MKTASDVSMAVRPFGLQDMVKAAMGTALSKTQISETARQELAGEKTASVKTAGLTKEYTEKLSSALSFMAVELEKEAADMAGPYKLTEHHQEVGKGPGALKVHEAVDGKPVGGVNRGEAHSPVPMHPGQEKHLAHERGEQLMASNLHSPPGGGGTQNTTLPANKGKLASAPVDLIRGLTKKAEDAINPAKISAGPADPRPGTDATQSAGGFPGNSNLIESNDKARNYTKGDAKSPTKSDMATMLDEKAMGDGEVLRAAFGHTGEAGTKMSSAPGTTEVKTAAARSLLARLAKTV